MSTCDRIVVIDFGRVIASGTPDEIRGNEAVREAYLCHADEVEDAIDLEDAPGVAEVST